MLLATIKDSARETGMEMVVGVHPRLGNHCKWAVATAGALGWLDEPPPANSAVCPWLGIPYFGG